MRNTKRNIRPNWRSSKEFKATYIPQFQCICMVLSEESINPSGTDAQENMVEVQEYIGVPKQPVSLTKILAINILVKF